MRHPRSRRARILRPVALAIVLAPPLLFAVAALRAQRADYGWRPRVASPTFTTEHPRVVVDEAHHNASTARLASRYWPFAKLLAADGYEVRRGTAPFAAAALDGVQVLVVANASGAPRPQLFGINLPVPTRKQRGDAAFTAAEIAALSGWVEQGGSLLLIADHAPFGAASAALAAAFGVTMHGGFVEVPDETSDPLLFSRGNGRLGDHPILAGDGPATAVSRLMTFTGQSLDGPPAATALLRLPASAIEFFPDQPGRTPVAAGAAQGLAVEHGKGRLVVLGEAAMLTAQVDAGKPFGMDSPANDNRRFALNAMHWLSRRL